MNRQRLGLFCENWRYGVGIFAFYSWFLAVQWCLYKLLVRVPHALGFDAIRATITIVDVIVAALLCVEWQRLRANRIGRQREEREELAAWARPYRLSGRAHEFIEYVPHSRGGERRLPADSSAEVLGPKFKPLFPEKD